MNKKKIQKVDYGVRALKEHKRFCGKLSVISKISLKTLNDWSTYYTPGVAAVASHVAKHEEDARKYTIKRNTVAVISDGSAVLGLGNIGPYGALPVMEGKCVIFKEMADIDAFPIVLDTQNVDEIVRTIKNIAPVFGGINLEDISAPRCFEIEDRLKDELSIPIMHDDQHGTAVVVLAGLINAAKVVKKNIQQLKVVVVGAGAAGRAITLLLIQHGIAQIVVIDSKGVINTKRKDLVSYKKELAVITNPPDSVHTFKAAICDADVVIGVSGPGNITKLHIQKMARNPIVFALANPIPEIMPKDALAAGAAIIATGRSDFPNQVNNSLVFPGIFRGALDRKVERITDGMKLNAAKKLAALIKTPTSKNILPLVSDRRAVKVVASAIK